MQKKYNAILQNLILSPQTWKERESERRLLIFYPEYDDIIERKEVLKDLSIQANINLYLKITSTRFAAM